MPRGDVAAGERRPDRFLRLGIVPRQVVLLIFLGRVLADHLGAADVDQIAAGRLAE
jgi:hypothetical protein